MHTTFEGCIEANKIKEFRKSCWIINQFIHKLYMACKEYFKLTNKEKKLNYVYSMGADILN